MLNLSAHCLLLFLAAFAMDSPKVLVLDIRYPTLPVAQLQRHQVGSLLLMHGSFALASVEKQLPVWLQAAAAVFGGFLPLFTAHAPLICPHALCRQA